MLDYKKDYILENDYVKLTPLERKHISELLPIATDPEIWVFLLEKGNTEKRLHSYVEAAIGHRENKSQYPFIVYDKVQRKYAGLTRLYEYSQEINTIKLGHTWYGKMFRGTGLNTHCKYIMFEFLFESVGVERIGFGSYAENTSSLKAMKKVGCKEEGRLRNMFPSIKGDGRSDAVLMSILKEEWNSKIKAKLKQDLYKV